MTKRKMLENRREEHAQRVAWSPTGLRIALGGSTGAIEIWSIAPPKRELTYTGHAPERITEITWSPDGTHLALVHVDGTVRLATSGGVARACAAESSTRLEAS